jgi:hypothetical protein
MTGVTHRRMAPRRARGTTSPVEFFEAEATKYERFELQWAAALPVADRANSAHAKLAANNPTAQ